MKLNTPRWWYRRERIPSPIARFLLTPVSWVWRWATARRKVAARSAMMARLPARQSRSASIAQVSAAWAGRGAQICMVSKAFSSSARKAPPAAMAPTRWPGTQ